MRIVNPIGKKGEDLAVEYLKKKGYKILERNYRKQYAEIDIIAIDPTTGSGNKILVFIEVKTRTSQAFGTPFEAITYWKLKPLMQAAQYYKISHNNLPDAMRIDAIAVAITDTGTPVIEHMENISGF